MSATTPDSPAAVRRSLVPIEPTDDRRTKNFKRQLRRDFAQVYQIAGRPVVGIPTPVENAAFELEPGGLAIDQAAPTHYISVLASHFAGEKDNPQGEQITDPNGDQFTIVDTRHEPGDPELRFIHPVQRKA